MICTFTCPNGHVLQGLETHLGQQCVCPQCGVTFTVQTILPASLQAAEPQSEAGESTADEGIPDFNAEWRSEGFSFESNDTGQQGSAGFEAANETADFTTLSPADGSTDFLTSVSDSGPSQFDPSTLDELGDHVADQDSELQLPSGAEVPGAAAKEFYHIRCPKKHLLEVRGDALNTDMDCPVCGTRFHVRLDRTLEFRRKREQEEERHDAKQGQIWLSVAIAAGTIILLGLVALIIMSNSGR